jgi:hypothetical protein
MLKEMAQIAVECLKHPRRKSIWVPGSREYVCPKTEAARRALALEINSVEGERTHPPLDPQFKLVFLTAAGGTLLFIVLCLVLTLIAGKEPPPLFEKVVTSLFDLAKIGFGAVVGLLGGKQLQGKSIRDDSTAPAQPAQASSRQKTEPKN